MWKKISSKIIFNHPRLKVEEDAVLISNEKKVKYLKYGLDSDGVVLVCVNNKGELLFTKEYSYLPNKNIIQLPMGMINKGEGRINAARRELLEETGYIAKELNSIGFYWQHHRRSMSKGYVYFVSNPTLTTNNPDIEEAGIKYIWLEKKEIYKMIKNHTILDADTLASLQIFNLINNY